MRMTIVASIMSLFLMASPMAAEGGSIKGSVGYTPEMAWDYDRDKKINRVQFWIDIDIKTEGKAIKGGVRRYLKDLDSGRKIYHWANMQMTGDNRTAIAPIAATHFAVKGSTAEFTVHDVTYTFTDSGDVSGQPPGTFLADDGFTKTEVKIHAGGVEISGP